MESRKEGILRHLAVIMDGNGRWAQKRHLSLEFGHRRGAENLRTLCILCRERKIQYITGYAFSTENWKRPATELSAKMNTDIRVFRQYMDELEREGIRLRFIGDRIGLPAEVIETMVEAEESSKNRQKLQLIIALNYGGRREIITAARALSSNILAGTISEDEVTEEIFEQHLYLSDVPDPDLIIRTGGEMRLSNFLLWQAAYAEFYSVDCLWPDFGAEELDAALEDYSKRQRRYGGV